MNHNLVFDRSEPDGIGHPSYLSARVRRLVAPNSGPFTFTGTCTYLVGENVLVVIDPGPEDDQHFQNLVAAIGSAGVSHILITHTHKDHSPLARRLAEFTGALIWGAGPHQSARDLNAGEVNALDASADYHYNPDRVLFDGEILRLNSCTFEVVATPGHTMNHLAFALKDDRALFSGDHVMAWSTSIIAPPDGAMGVYMRSLDKLQLRDETIYWPGHGSPVKDPHLFVQGLIAHRKARETSILDKLSHESISVSELVEKIYIGLADPLKGAAALSVFAHLEDLVHRRLVSTDGDVLLTSRYRLR